MKTHLTFLVCLVALLSPSIAQATDPYDNEYFKIEFYKDQQLVKDGQTLTNYSNQPIFQLKSFGNYEFKVQTNPYSCRGVYNFYTKIVLKDSIQFFEINGTTAINDTVKINLSSPNGVGYGYFSIKYKKREIGKITQHSYPFQDVISDNVTVTYKNKKLDFLQEYQTLRCTLEIENATFEIEAFRSYASITYTDLFGTSLQSVNGGLSRTPESYSLNLGNLNTGDVIRYKLLYASGGPLGCVSDYLYEIYIINRITTGLEEIVKSNNSAISINDNPLLLDYEGELQEVQLISTSGQTEIHKTTDIHTLLQGISIVRAVTHKGVYLSRVILK